MTAGETTAMKQPSLPADHDAMVEELRRRHALTYHGRHGG